MKKMSGELTKNLNNLRIFGSIYTILAIVTILYLVELIHIDGGYIWFVIIAELILAIYNGDLIDKIKTQLPVHSWRPFATLNNKIDGWIWLGIFGLAFLYVMWANDVEEEWGRYETHTDAPPPPPPPPKEKETSMIDVISFMNREKEKKGKTDKFK